LALGRNFRLGRVFLDDNALGEKFVATEQGLLRELKIW
jgi:hypothetical protein